MERINRYLRNLNYNLEREEISLEYQEHENKRYKDCQSKINDLVSLKNDMLNYRDKINQLKTVVSLEDSNHTERLLSFLSQVIEDNLSVIFPFEEYGVRIDYDYKRNKHKARLLLLPANGNETLPAEEGRMFGQIISFSSAISLLSCMGIDKLYLDEAFCAASDTNLAKTNKLIGDLVNKGFQIFLIEQRDFGFKELPRREIRIEKCPIAKATRIQSITDF